MTGGQKDPVEAQKMIQSMTGSEHDRLCKEYKLTNEGECCERKLRRYVRSKFGHEEMQQKSFSHLEK